MSQDLFSTELERRTGAAFSPCRRWRYRLWRIWDEAKPYANFLMLNPSTADELTLDPTCNKCRSYATELGYGALIVTNLFAWRSTDPMDMKKAADPVGPDNDAHILEVATGAGIVICAWGNHGTYRDRSATVRTMLRAKGVQLHALILTGTGEPGHPLYLRSELKPQPL